MPQKPDYRRIADDISERIRNGELKPGTQLKPLRDLAEEYGVSISTVQRGIGLLADRGRVVGHQGKAIFVVDPQPPWR